MGTPDADISITGGGLTAVFDRTTFTFGGVGIGLRSESDDTVLTEEIDLELSAPYSVNGRRINFRKGRYKLVALNAVLVIQAITVPHAGPRINSVSPPATLGYSCTPGRLRLEVRAGPGTVTLALARQR